VKDSLDQNEHDSDRPNMSSRFREGTDFPGARYSLLLLVGAMEDKGEIFSHFPWRCSAFAASAKLAR
jgi:hypothetical protein